jgi:hypothetical protein
LFLGMAGSSRLWDRYILNTFPLLHIVLLAVLLTVTLRIALSFHFHYGARPVLTLCVVSALLASISDTLAQMTEVIRSRSRSPPFKTKDSVVIGEIELQEKTPSPAGSPTVFAWTGADRHVDFDFPRLVRFMAYGFLFAPIAVRRWFLVVLMVVYMVWVLGTTYSCRGVWTRSVKSAG